MRNRISQLQPIGPLPVPLGGGRVRDVLDAVASVYDVRVGDIRGASQLRRHVDPRHVAMWILRQDNYSLPEIAFIFGRDHTSVLYACRRVDAWRKLSQEFQQILSTCGNLAQAAKTKRRDAQRERRAACEYPGFVAPTG